MWEENIKSYLIKKKNFYFWYDLYNLFNSIGALYFTDYQFYLFGGNILKNDGLWSQKI